MAIRWIIGWFLAGILGFSLLTSCNAYRSGEISPLEQPVGKCRTIQHKLGETCVPEQPQRIVTLSLPTLSDAISLGVEPIGSTYIDDWYFAPYLDGKLDSVEVLGNENVNLEKLLLLKPDLTVGFDWNEDAYPLLSKIAPTVLYDWDGPRDWRNHFNFLAEVLGKQQEAQQVWNRYYQRIEELKKALGNRYDNKTISLVLIGPKLIFSEAKGSFADSILKDAGLQRPAAQDVIVSESLLPISEEILEKADGDFLFFGALEKEGVSEEEAKEKIQQIKQKPLWQKLQAVQDDHVYIVDHITWRGGNVLAADAVIDDLFKYLVNIDDT